MDFFGSLFEFLFKYRPVVFERGDLVLGSPRAVAVLALAAAVGVPAVLTYARARARTTRRDRIVLASLRAAALALLAVCLLRPTLLVSAAVPQRNVLAILVDDSRSMRIADAGGATRGAVAARILGGADSALAKELGQRFLLRWFRFASDAERVESASALQYDGGRTRLGEALLRTREELAAVPLAGLVVVTDGADNAAGAPDERGVGDALAAMRARGVPVYTVGVGSETWEKDVRLTRVEAPRAATVGASLALTVTVAQRGFAGASVPVVVEDSGRIVASRSITLPRDGEAAVVRVHVPARETGARRLRVRIAPQRGELVAENNERYALVAVRDRREKLLYVEGEPRPEMPFLRRAIADDSLLQLVTLQRTAEDKFLRLGVDDSLQLVTGFPTTREELFAYRGIVLGSVEASFFTADQLRMLADFVSERGGGLLALGGRRALAEGGYAGTALADALPFALDARLAVDPAQLGDAGEVAELRPVPTAMGTGHAALQIAPDEAASAARWRALPAVTSVNRIGALKPGATTLLSGEGAAGERQPILVWQRFGRGKTIALPVQDTWMWQMHADIAVDDQTHETFWRQLLRWLASDVPDRVMASASADRVGAGEAVTLRGEVSDAAFARVNGDAVTAEVTAPDGRVTALPLAWSVERDGEYRASWSPPSDGMYEVRVTARGERDSLRSLPTFVEAAPPREEFFDAEMRRPLLERIADETGGRFYTPSTASNLPKDVAYTRSGTTTVERMDVWDMPVIFMLLVALLGTEWAYRRARGLA